MKCAIYFADDHLQQSFLLLQSGRAEDREISAGLNSAFDTIARNPFCGIQVPKRLIPKRYRTKYGVDNVWKINISGNWRLMYSVAGNGTEVIAIILEWLPHKEYERRFGY